MNVTMKSAEPAIAVIRASLGDRLVTTEAVREHHSHDTSRMTPSMPDAVAFPVSEEEVQLIVRACAEHRVPIVPFGAGSSMEGHTIPTQGGVSVDTSQMNRILAVHPEDFTATVQPGVTRKQLNVDLRDTGLMFSVDPGADEQVREIIPR